MDLFFKEKKQTYLALIDAACEIAACKDRQEVTEKAPSFIKLYYGRAHAIADLDESVFNKKIKFRQKLRTYLNDQIDEVPYKYFGNFALDLTTACKDHIDPRTLVASEP